MAYGGTSSPRPRLCVLVLTTALLASGCTGGDRDEAAATASPAGTAVSEEGADDAASPDTGTADTGTAGGADTPAVDLADAPKTRRQALRFARRVVAGPASWGVGFVRGDRYRSGPDTMAELDEDCVWERRPLDPAELVSVTRRSVLPAGDGKGRFRVAAIVTVYRDELSAKWDMARTLEEALRCPDQQLNATERVTSLVSTGPSARMRAGPHRDFIVETGGVGRDGPDDPHPYSWTQYRFGTVTVSTVVKGARGYDRQAVQRAMAKGQAHMQQQAELEWGGSK